MKNVYLALFLLFSANIFSQSIAYTDKRGNEGLLGKIERAELQKEPFNKWYTSFYDGYKTDEEIIKKIDDHYNSNIKIKAYMGTWCGDSKKAVPRFLKIVDQSKINIADVELIGLDDRSDKYKQGPNGEEKGLNIHRVPTFIFYENGEEIGRIVESPVSRLEVDVAQVYAGLPTTPNYFIANYAGKLFQDSTIAAADSTLTKYAPFLKRKIKNEGELNTYGYVLLSAKEYQKAIVVFKLNTLLFPGSGNTFDSLGEAYMKNGDTKLAIENYLHAIQLDSKNENAIKMVQELAGVENGG